MSFQNNCTSMPSGSTSVPYGDTACDSSMRIGQKRAQPSVMDTYEEEIFSNKKQVTESLEETSAAPIMNNYSFGGCSSSRARGQIGDSLMSAKPVWSSTESYTNVQSILSSNLHVDKKDIDLQYGNDTSTSLSMPPQAVGDPYCLNSELPVMDINDLGISEDFLSEFLGNSSRAEENTLASTIFQRPGDDMFPVLNNNTTHGDALSMSTAFSNIYNELNELIMSAGSTNSTENTDAILTTTVRGQHDAAIESLGTVNSKKISSILPMGHSCEQTTLSFGGFQNNPEASITCTSPSNILLNQSSAQSLGLTGLKIGVQELGANIVSAATTSVGVTKSNQEQRISKIVSSNNFPENVRSLLSTGILDGVPVKYVSRVRKINLQGVVQAPGYLCGCNACNLSKVVNAPEFEQHAGCETSHPNNHIYFENGKTIYAAVQSLKRTPQDMLFEAIQNMAGSPINQINFQTWKASYQAEICELQ